MGSFTPSVSTPSIKQFASITKLDGFLHTQRFNTEYQADEQYNLRHLPAELFR